MDIYRNIDRTKVQFDFLVHRIEEGIFDKEIQSLGGKIYRLKPITPKSLLGDYQLDRIRDIAVLFNDRGF